MENFGTIVLSVLLLALAVLMFVFALNYIKGVNNGVKNTLCGKQAPKYESTTENRFAGLEVSKFDRQEYVQNHPEIFGFHNRGDSMDDREIQEFDYDKMGL